MSHSAVNDEGCDSDVRPEHVSFGRQLFRMPVRILAASPVMLWLVNIGLAIILAIWLYADPRFEASVSWWRYQSIPENTSQIRDMGDWQWLTLRNRGAAVLVGAALASAVLLLAGLALGTGRHRTTRVWLLAVAMLSVWLAIGLSWRDITWMGKQHRLTAILGDFDTVVADLQREWPQRDGERKIIGPFMAYPVDDPGTLILLTLPIFKNTATTCSVIEGGDGIFRFELVGTERGDWIEWHPDRSSPRDFLSGLGEVYKVKRFKRLNSHWYLVRY